MNVKNKGKLSYLFMNEWFMYKGCVNKLYKFCKLWVFEFERLLLSRIEMFFEIFVILECVVN